MAGDETALTPRRAPKASAGMGDYMPCPFSCEDTIRRKVGESELRPALFHSLVLGSCAPAITQWALTISPLLYTMH